MASLDVDSGKDQPGPPGIKYLNAKEKKNKLSKIDKCGLMNQRKFPHFFWCQKIKHGVKYLRD